jgi:hypothetical protein
MKTGEARLRARPVFPSEAAFRARQQPQSRAPRGVVPHLPIPGVAIPTVLFAVPSARKARARSLFQYGMSLNVGSFLWGRFLSEAFRRVLQRPPGTRVGRTGPLRRPRRRPDHANLRPDLGTEGGRAARCIAQPIGLCP